MKRNIHNCFDDDNDNHGDNGNDGNNGSDDHDAGSIPSSFSNISALEELYLFSNSLRGENINATLMPPVFTFENTVETTRIIDYLPYTVCCCVNVFAPQQCN